MESKQPLQNTNTIKSAVASPGCGPAAVGGIEDRIDGLGQTSEWSEVTAGSLAACCLLYEGADCTWTCAPLSSLCATLVTGDDEAP